MNRLVSVVIPAYNREKEIMKALSSVAEQTYPYVEVIVIDDGSSDRTVEVVREARYRMPVRVIALGRNQGIAAARNVGIDAARGEYIAFLDSDDWWLPGKLSHQVNLLEQSGGPDANTLVYSRIEILRARDRVVRPSRAIRDQEEFMDYVAIGRGLISNSTFILPSRVAKLTRYSHSPPHEDWVFFSRLQKAGVRFVMAPQVLSIWDDRMQENRASRALSSLAWLEEHRSLMSERAVKALRAKTAPQLRSVRPLGAAASVFKAWHSDSISIWHAGLLIAELIYPPSRHFLRAAATKLSTLTIGSGRGLK
jgi:glycosyltransferase involved in cell wall biosynthesis